MREALNQAARDPEEVSKRMQQLAQDAASTIESMRRHGHSLYLHTFEFQAVEAAYKAAPSAWEPLLGGVDAHSNQFQERVGFRRGCTCAFAKYCSPTPLPRGFGYGAPCFKA